MRRIQYLTDIAGASYLFESHLGVTQSGGRSSAWADTQTASGLNASQASSTQYPYYTASDANFNGYPTLNWPLAEVANLLYLESGALGAPVVPPFTYIAAVRSPDVSANRVIMRERFVGVGQNVANFIVLPTAAIRFTGNAAPFVDSAAGKFAINTTSVLIMTRDVAQGAVYLNGVRVSGGALAATSGFDGVRIGATFIVASGPAALFPWVGDIAVCGAWSRLWSAGEIRRASELLMRRYGIALPVRSAKTRTPV